MRQMLSLLLLLAACSSSAFAQERTETDEYTEIVAIAKRYIDEGGPSLQGRHAGCAYWDIPIMYNDRYVPTRYFRIFPEPCAFGLRMYIRPDGMGHLETVTSEEAIRLVQERMPVAVATQ